MRVFENRELRSLFLTAFFFAAACIAVVLVKPPEAKSQCQGGNCPAWRQPDVRVQAPGVNVRVKGQPRAAWRYERPEKHRKAVVRVFCKDSVRVSSIGSGVLVRWGKRVVVLTARHVVQDAKSILIKTYRKKTYRARVLKVDVAWDCAVLAVDGKPDVEPADMELGAAAMQRSGNRLESCGYGPDGRLASNTGLFLGYKRSGANPNQPPDDWMELSGHARGGDSGGPIFNSRGRVVGVLWGTDGSVVVGVQAGRLHLLLDSINQKSYVQLAYQIERQPTPALPGPVMIDDLPDANVEPVAKGQTNPILPWRGEAQKRDDELDARTRALLGAIERDRANRQTSPIEPPIVVDVPPPPVCEPVPDGPKPLVVVLLCVGALVVGVVIYYVIQKG